MPLITSPVLTPPRPPQPPPVLPEIGFATATYTAPNGEVWPLSDDQRGWFTLADGVSGLGAAPVDLTTDAHPRGGSRLRHVQPQSRTIVWPLHVYSDSTHMEFVTRWRALAAAFTRTLREGPGVLEIARPDGTRRQIKVIYQEGFEGRGTQGSGIVSDTAVLTLYCEDPYWVDPVGVTVHREHAVGSSFFEPYPTISSGQVLGATTIDNPGDVLVWPTWVITGPAASITFTHTHTGQAFTLNPSSPAVGHGNLQAGQRVTVSTDPPRVRYQSGANWIGALNWPGAQLWPLRPGANPVTFQLNGSGPGSAVDLVFNPRYETA
ncbi:phage tail family protein [Streptomyces corynorhini]|uniref:Phage tail protein n=1 Tax=Streptomyces corynorhini TaxID=2282652 RepID=A0A370B829_9ACTN|nr:phage tail domain-containing protein [Streptomyces corynorhini]RDG37968.1 phage tail protein [Streptomyces corynorhini]